jgi:hypothetical protein
MRDLREPVVFGIGAFAWLAPWMLIGTAWWRSRSQRSDTTLIIGNLFATASCSWLLPFAVPNTTRWEQLRVDVLSYGVIASAACALLAISVLPFAYARAKWFSLSGSAINACMIAIFFLSLG